MKILSLIILDYRGGYAYHNTLEEGDGQRRDPQGKDIAGQNNDWTNSVRIADGLGKTGRGVKFKNTYNYPTHYYHNDTDVYGKSECDISYIHQSAVNTTKNISNDPYYKDPNSFYKVKTNGGGKVITSVDVKGIAGALNIKLNGGVPGTTCEGNWVYDESLSALELHTRLSTKGSKIKIKPKPGYTPSSSYREVTSGVVSRNRASNVADFNYRYYSSIYSIYNEGGQWYLSTDTPTIDSLYYVGVVYPIRSGELNKYVWPQVFNKPDVTTPVYENVTVDSIQPNDPIIWCLTSYGIGLYSTNLNYLDWTTLSKNVDLSSISSYSEYYPRLCVSCSTDSELQLDNVRFAYAPKSKLYRDNQLIMDDYSVEYTDKDAKDTAAPNAPTSPVVSISGVGNLKADLSWGAASDNGTTYNYEVSYVNSDNVESAKVSKSVTQTSGIDHYELYNTSGKLQNISASSTSVSINAADYDRSTYIIAVDKAGNKSAQVNFFQANQSVIPPIEDASNGSLNRAIPTWTDSMITQSPTESKLHLNWDTPISESDIISTETFEGKEFDYTQEPPIFSSGYDISNFHGYIYNGNSDLERNIDRLQSLMIKPGFGINNSTGMRVHNTYGHGTSYFVPTKAEGIVSNPVDTTKVNVSGFRDTNWKLYKKDRKIITRVSAKGKGGLTLCQTQGFSGNVKFWDHKLTYAENMTEEEFRQRCLNKTPIKLNNPEGYTCTDSWITTRTTEDLSGTFNYFHTWAYVKIDEFGQTWMVPRDLSYYSADVRPDQIATGSKNAQVDAVHAGDRLTVVVSSTDFYSKLDIDSPDKFTTISTMTSVPLNNIGDYYRVLYYASSPTDLFIDDIQIAYAPKSRLYRTDLTEPLAEDYTVEYDDTSAKDLASPSNPTKLKIEPKDKTNQTLVLSWDPAIDNGTSYTYKVTSINSDGYESSKSADKTLVQTSGIGHYELIDVEGNIVAQTSDDSTALEIEATKYSSSLKLVAVDKVGNKSEGVKFSEQPQLSTSLLTTEVFTDAQPKARVSHTIPDSVQSYANTTTISEEDVALSSTPTDASTKYDLIVHESGAPAPVLTYAGFTSDNQTGKSIVKISEPADTGSNDYIQTESKGQTNSFETSSMYAKVPTVSGLKGYSYVIDDNVDTDPGDIINLRSNTLEVDKSAITNASYLHIKAFDKFDNKSEVSHLKLVDTTAPTSPSNIKGQIASDNTSVELSWSECEDIQSPTVSYKVYYNNTSRDVSETTTSINLTEFNDVSITSVDLDGNESEKVSVDAIKVISVPNYTKTAYKYQYISGSELLAGLGISDSIVAIETNYGELPQPIVWDLTSYQNDKTNQEFISTINFTSPYITNPDNLNTKLSLLLKDYNVSDTVINNYPGDEDNFRTVDVVYGTSVDMSVCPDAEIAINGEARNIKINWNEEDLSKVDTSKVNATYIVSGTLQPQENLNVAGVTVYVRVNIIPSEVVSVAVLSDTYTAPVYSDFNSLNLPNKVDVTFNNGQVIPLNTTWNASELDRTSVDLQIITGYIPPTDVPLGYTVNSSLILSAKVKLSQATIDNLVYLTDEKELTDNTLPITFNINDSDFIQALPTKARITLSARETLTEGSSATPVVQEVPVTFNTDSFDKYQLGIQSLVASLGIDSTKLKLPTTTDLKVNVIPATVAYILTDNLELTGDLGKLFSDFPELQEGATKVSVMLGNGSVYGDDASEVISVMWKSAGYDNTLTNQTLIGNMQLPEGIQNDLNKVFKATITLKKTTEKKVIKVANLSDIKLPTGVDLSSIYLPEEVEVCLSDGTSDVVKITKFNQGTYDKSKAGTYILEGELQLSEGVSNPQHYKAIQRVQVVDPKSDSSLSDDAIIKIDTQDPVITIPGRTPEIPSKVTIVLPDGSKVEVPVDYDTSDIDFSKPGTYVVEGKIPDKYPNPNGVKPRLEVIIPDLESTSPMVVKVLPLPTISAKLGTELNSLHLGNIIRVQLSDNRIINVAANLDSREYNPNSTELQQVSGILILPNNVTNPVGLKANINIQLRASSPTDIGELYAEQIGGSTIVVQYGTQLKDIPIPESVPVTLSDGSITYVRVSWDTSSYNPMRPGIYDAIGSIIESGYENTDLKSVLKIQVLPNSKDIKGDKTVISISAIPSISIQAGKNLSANKLPAEVEVTLENGTKIKLPVKWDYVSQNIYTSKVVKGTAQILEGMFTLVKTEVTLKINVIKTGDKGDDNIPSDEKGGSGSSSSTGNSRDNSEVDESNEEKDTSSTTETINPKDINSSTKTNQPETNDNKADEKSQQQDQQKPQQPHPNQEPQTNQKPQTNESTTVSGNLDKDGITLKPNQSTIPSELTKEYLESKYTEGERNAIDKKVLYNVSSRIPYTLPSRLMSANVINNLLYTTVQFNKAEDGMIKVQVFSYYNDAVVYAKLLNLQSINKIFKDVPQSHWAYTDIKALCNKGYVTGTTENTFSPSQPLMMSDTFTFLDRVLANYNILTVKNDRTYVESVLTDKDHWAFYNSASILSKMNTSTIASNPKFLQYDSKLTREDVAVVIYDILSEKITAKNAKSLEFVDADKITQHNAVEFCAQLGLFEGDESGNFNPTDTITRAELVKVLNQLDNILE